MNPLIQFKKESVIVLSAFVLACFVLLPVAQAVNPAPDGGYPGGNTAEGDFALQNLTTGTFDTALGAFALFSNSAGLQNTATGAGALFRNTEGFNNTANGAGALENNTLGKANTAIGFAALFSNTTISGNTGNQNTAIGNTALLNNTIGTSNTAVGSQALLNNVEGNRNTAVGKDALFTNKGVDNTAVGFQALFSNQDGNFNVAIGNGALMSNVHNIGNTAVGFSAGNVLTSDSNTLIGASAGSGLTTGGGNICIGAGVVGNPGEFNTIRIGDNDAHVTGTTSKVFIGGISGTTVGAASAPVLINLNGQLGTTVSSARFKKDIESMGRTSEAIYSLTPVTFHYKGDETNMPCFGLIAEEVAKVDPTLILQDKEGRPQTVRYEQINAMLLNEFLKAHRKMEKQEAAIAGQEKQIEALVTIVKEQANQIQKVSAQLEVSKAPPQTVSNNQ